MVVEVDSCGIHEANVILSDVLFVVNMYADSFIGKDAMK